MLRNVMFLLVFALFGATAIVQTQGAAVQPKGSSLRYLGKFQKPMTITDLRKEGEPSTQQTSLYFLSQNAAGFATGENDCKENLSPEATLLYIETQEELAKVEALLASSDDTGSSYWVGGKYDPNTRKFVWLNNFEIGLWAPWDTGMPDTQVPITRIVAATAGGLKLRTQFQTVSNRYICELQVSARHTAPQFKYLGQYKSPERKIGVNGVSIRASSFYFLSQNAAAFQSAENDCKAFLGEDANLLYIETKEELGNVTKFLSDLDDNGSIYWVGAKYDTAKQTFVWLNGAELGPWAPWDSGMPNTRLTVTRVSVCKVIPCYNDNDLVIVIDSSGSIDQSNYMVSLEFTTRLAIAWADNPKNRVSVLIFSDSVQSIINHPDNLSVSQIRDRVYTAPYMAGNTASDLGLNAAIAQFASNQRSVPKNLVFMTDGASNSASATIAAAGRVQSAGIKAFSVGIGSSLNPTELLAIAQNKPEHVFNTDGFADLLKLLQPVSITICP